MDERGYYTYIMASRSHTLYIGVTGDLEDRVFPHKWREHEGFTARCNCDRFVWFKRHASAQAAIAVLKGHGLAARGKSPSSKAHVCEAHGRIPSLKGHGFIACGRAAALKGHGFSRAETPRINSGFSP